MRLLGGILLVAGTTIGAAMLALPVTTGIAGFWPALILFVIVWALMLYSAFLLLETNLAYEGRINLVTMARRTLGPIGEIVAWLAYLLLLYSLMAAYLSGCSSLVMVAAENLLGFPLPLAAGILPVVVVFGAIVYLGIASVDHLNRWLMVGLGLTFVILLFTLVGHVRADLLARTFPEYAIVPVAVVVTSFGYHIIIPSLVEYLDRDVKQLKRCLLWGSLVPLGVYLIWEFVIVGSLPLQGSWGLKALLESGQPASHLSGSLRTLTHSPVVAWAAGLLSFFAIVTSFLGVSLSLSDFLRDGLHIEESIVGRLLVTLLTFVPPLAFAWLYPEGFILALSYGGLFVAILLGLLPVSMVFIDRYVRRRERSFKVWGGPILLIAAFACFVLVIVIEFVDTSIAQELLLEI